MNRLLACLGIVASLAACGSAEDSLDPNAQYMLAVSSASIKATNVGAAWDADSSAPDVFVTFDGSPTSIVESYAPSWSPVEGVVYTVAKLKGAGVAPVVVQLLDFDPLDPNDPITAAYSVTLTEDQIRSGSYTWTNVDGANSVTFVLIAQ